MTGGDQRPTPERRSLADGLAPRPDVTRAVEERFVRGDRGPAAAEAPGPAVAAPPPTPVTPTVGRTPVSTRIRADYAAALKRASLERQLAGVTPNTLQDILEEALGPWLAANGYLTPSRG
ncbi:MAG: hypothetical protein K2X87_08335 [Gemmataceae bacterium]|nr:hypothetical protein [Gemmataceae bacterium]